MYERYFGFEEAPFRLTPDPRYLFLSAKHREALGHLVYGLKEGAGFVAITGEIGAGKTTLLRSFLSDPPPNARYAYILNPVLAGVELLQEINHELGLRQDGTQRDLLIALNDFLVEQKGQGNQVVLVIDEAQALGAETLEQLRLLSNFETDTAKLLQIVLVGQPELRDLLARPDLVQLEQRITVRWHLGALDCQETRQYVTHRLSTASGGRARRIFSAAALRRIYAYSQGLPRRINLVCHRALLVAYARDSTSVSRSIVNRAIEEIEAPRRRDEGAARAAAWRAISSGARLGAGLAAALVVGGLAVLGGRTLWAPTARPRPAVGGPAPAIGSGADLARAIDPGSGADLARAIDAVGSGGFQEVSAVASGPRVAPHPLTPPLASWPEPAAEPAPGSAAGSVTGAAVPAARAASAPPAVSDEGREADAAIMASLADPRWLERASLNEALRQTTPGESAYEAVEELVVLWKSEPLSAAEAASQDLDLPSIAARRGLSYVEFRGNLSVLRMLDVPAILELDSGEGSGVTFALVDRIEDEAARLRVGRSTVEVSHGVLSEVWFGHGHLLWYDADKLGDLLARGTSGPAVRRLHALLADAGAYGGAGGDLFDEATEEAVMRFQRAAHLEADGKVGPMTMIALYGVAAPERVPHLATASTGVDVAVAAP